MKKIFFPLCAFAAAVSLQSCSETDELLTDSETEPQLATDEDYELPYAQFFDFDSSDFRSTNKSSTLDEEETDGQRYFGSDFHDGGVVVINGRSFDTVIAGNHRWIVGFYEKLIDGNGVSWKDSTGNRPLDFELDDSDDDVYYYPYSFAKTFKDVKAQRNKYLPDGFEELSGWKIPTLGEWEDLCLMVANGKTKEQRSLHLLQGLGMPFASARINNKEKGYPVVFPDIAVFFLEYENVTPQYTYWDLGYVADKDVPQYTYGFINTGTPNLFAPIKLFQRVKPIFYEADSLRNIAKVY